MDVTGREAALLRDLLDWWIEGFAAAREQTIDDPTIEDVDQLLDLVSSSEDEKLTAVRLREKVTNELTRAGSGSAAGDVYPLS